MLSEPDLTRPGGVTNILQTTYLPTLTTLLVAGHRIDHTCGGAVDGTVDREGLTGVVAPVCGGVD